MSIPRPIPATTVRRMSPRRNRLDRVPAAGGGAALAVVMITTALVAVASGRAGAADAAPDDVRELRFTRVHVPKGRIAGLVQGPTRYVPMSVREFEEAVARLSAVSRGGAAAQPGLEPLATAARYAAAVTDSGELAGTVAFEVSAQPAGQRGLSREMPFGDLAVRRGTVRTAAGTGEAVVFGRPGGGVAVATPDPGEYTCLFECGPSARTSEGPAFSLPLVPSLFSSVALRMPDGLRPVLVGDAAVAGAVTRAGTPAADGVEWRIDVGPLRALDFVLARDARDPPRLSIWSAVTIRGRQAALAVTVVPQTPWTEGPITLRTSPALVVSRVRMGTGVADSGSAPGLSDAAWQSSADGTAVTIFLPGSSAGHRHPILVHAVAPLGGDIASEPRPLPAIHAPPARWAGGGVVLEAEPSLSLAGIELRDCVAVMPEVAARWPLLTDRDTTVSALAAGTDADGGAGPGETPARVALEHQGPDATVELAVSPRRAELDIARVTTVDVSPGAVIGRAACDVRVNRGAAFEITASVTTGWVIDAVEAIAAADRSTPLAGRSPTDAGGSLEWKVVRGADGDLLRIGLTMAATPRRGLGLRITGHRAGVAPDVSFSSAEMEMVRLAGETEGLAAIEFRTNTGSAVEAGTTIEMEDQADTDAAVDPRLAALAEAGTLRGRVPSGPGAPVRRLRLVRRRPPLDVRTQVRLSVRDDKLAESFTFGCTPDRSELDAIVVHFTEPTDDRLEWSLLPPAVGAITARRTEQADRRRADATRQPDAAESWIVELSPPAREAVTIRAVRTVPFTAPVPVPLAWIEAATSQAGEVIVRDAGRRRPRVVNRRLRELPAGPTDADLSLATLVELSFDVTRDRGDDGLPAAELVPGDGSAPFESRAWAWQATTSSWCHASGAVEYETVFEIENHGRGSIAIGLPPGRGLQGVLVDGVAVPRAGKPDEGGLVTIDLPTGRRFVRVLVRSVAERDAGRGFWQVAADGGTIDAPVLDHRWRVLLPPELDILWASADFREVGPRHDDWTIRLLAATIRPAAAAGEAHAAGQTTADSSAVALKPAERPAAVGGGSLRAGFRERVLLPAGPRAAGGEITVVTSGMMSTAAMLAALIAAATALLISRGRPWPTVAACLVAALATLWLPTPFDAVARAAWWGTLAAILLRGRSGLFPAAGSSVTAVVLAIAVVGPGLPGEARAQSGDQSGDQSGESMRVFLTPVDRGETALVPETLFRALARSEASDAVAAVRVIQTRVLVGRSDGERWQLLLDVDADAGGTLVIDQTPSGARWVAGTGRTDGVPASARIERGGRLLLLPVSAAGRHRLEMEVEPSVSQRGDVVVTTAVIPVSPGSLVELVESASAAAFSRPETADREQCEAAPAGGPFMAARRVADRGQAGVFDVGRAAQVRLVRPLDPRARLADVVRKASSRNDVAWELDACRVLGTYTIDPGDEIVRSVVVRADPRLALAPPERPNNVSPFVSQATADGIDSAIEIKPIGGHRFLIERLWPTRGRVTVEIPLRMPLADPAGVFAVPEAWLEDVVVDERTTRLSPSRDLAVTVDPPPGATPVPPRDSEPSTQSWWIEVSRATVGDRTAEPTPAGRSSMPAVERPTLATFERRHTDVRGSQNLAVTFAADQTRLQLRARLDAMSTALFTIPVTVPTACVIDRVRLYEDDGTPAAETATRAAIDIRTSRRERGRVVAVVQQPRAGRFRLEVDARLPGPPPPTGPLPLMHADMAAGAPLLITSRGTDSTTVTVRRTDVSPTERVLEHFVDRPAPTYAIATTAGESDGERPPAPDEQAAAPDLNAVAAAAPAAADVEKRPRVALADIHLVADNRRRAWGLARFDVVAAESELHVSLPPGMRLFDLLVDGHAVGTVAPSLPHGGNAWTVRLLDVRWPRSVLAVFAGELEKQPAAGGTLRLPAPDIVGLPCERMLCTLHLPAGVEVRVAPPARIVGESALAAERLAAVGTLAEDFDRALAACSGLERGRLAELARLRKEAAVLPLEAAWQRILADRRADDAVSGPPIAIVAGPAGEGVTVGGFRRVDPTVPARGLATLALLAIGGAAWSMARRRPDDWRLTVERLAPPLAVLLGCGWLAALEPAWPGGIVAAVGAWAAVSRRHRPPTVDADRSLADRGSSSQTTPTPAPTASGSTRTALHPEP